MNLWLSKNGGVFGTKNFAIGTGIGDESSNLQWGCLYSFKSFWERIIIIISYLKAYKFEILISFQVTNNNNPLQAIVTFK